LGKFTSFLQIDLGAQLLQSPDVQVHRPCADGAAAGQRDLGVAVLGDQRPQHQDRGAHLAHQVIGRGGVVDVLARQSDRPLLAAELGRYFDAVLRQQIGHGGDVGQVRHAVQTHLAIGQQRRCHQRQRGVLGAADADFALQALAAANANAIHDSFDPQYFIGGAV
jgi:hypothetical protein